MSWQPDKSIFQAADRIPGWYPVENLMALAALAYLSTQSTTMPLFLEVGTWRGRSAYVLAAVAQHLKGNLLCVDTWKGLVSTPENDPRYSVSANEDILSQARDNLSLYSPGVQFLQGDSRDILSRMEGEDVFDFIHIDGDHTSPVVDEDVDNAWRLLKQGATMAGDDYQEPPVKRAVRKYGVPRLFRNRLWSLQKPIVQSVVHSPPLIITAE